MQAWLGLIDAIWLFWLDRSCSAHKVAFRLYLLSVASFCMYVTYYCVSKSTTGLEMHLGRIFFSGCKRISSHYLIVLRVRHRKALSHIKIPQTHKSYTLPLLQTEAGEEFLKHAGCSCQSVQLFSVCPGVRANNRLNLFCCYSCNLIASTFVRPVGICHKIWLIEQLILESFPLKYCQVQQGIVPMYTCHRNYLFCHFYLPRSFLSMNMQSVLVLSCKAFFF